VFEKPHFDRIDGLLRICVVEGSSVEEDEEDAGATTLPQTILLTLVNLGAAVSLASRREVQ